MREKAQRIRKTEFVGYWNGFVFYWFSGAFHTFQKTVVYAWKRLESFSPKMITLMWSHCKKCGLSTTINCFDRRPKRTCHIHIIFIGMYRIKGFQFRLLHHVNVKFDMIAFEEKFNFWNSSLHEFLMRWFGYWLLVYSSGVFGSGLCVLSKYPIISTLFHSWSVNGYVHRIQHGKNSVFCSIDFNCDKIFSYQILLNEGRLIIYSQFLCVGFAFHRWLVWRKRRGSM